MPHISGTVKAVYDNRLRNGQPNKFPNFKIIVDDVEATLWSAIQPVCKQGDKVSMHYGTSKKTGANFVLTDEDKNPKLQVMPEGSNLDDDLPQAEKEWLAAPAQPTDFNPNQYERENTMPKVVKEQQIFVTALLKSSIEGSFLNPFEREKVDKAILEFKDIYNKNFK